MSSADDRKLDETVYGAGCAVLALTDPSVAAATVTARSSEDSIFDFLAICELWLQKRFAAVFVPLTLCLCQPICC